MGDRLLSKLGSGLLTTRYVSDADRELDISFCDDDIYRIILTKRRLNDLSALLAGGAYGKSRDSIQVYQAVS